MKTYDYIYNLLQEQPDLRDSDKKLIWKIYENFGYVSDNQLTFDAFMNPNLPNFETIRRTRQKIQENHPQLQASESVQKARKIKQATKSTFVYRENVEVPVWKKRMESYEKDGRTYWREV